jgi:methyl-accepting chemotaxis protein
MGLTAKMTLLFNSLNALVLIIYGIISVRAQVAGELGGIDGKLALAAQSYVRAIGEGKMDEAFRNDATAQGFRDTGGAPEKEYLADVASMGRYASNLGLAYLYSMTIVDGKAKYVMDGAPQSEIDEGNFKYPMDDYPDASPMFFAAWEKWTPMAEEYTDSFGSFRSYFLPFVTKAGNKVLIGADIKIDDVKRKTRDIIVSQVSIVAVIFAIGFTITFIFAKVVARRVINIGNHINFMADRLDFTRDVAVRSNDEIGRMAESINKLQEVLKGAIRRAHDASVSNAAHAQQFGAAAASISSQVASSTLQVEQLHEHSSEIDRHAKAAAECAALVQTDIGETNSQLTDAHATLKDLVAGVNETAQNSGALAADLKELNVKMGSVKRILDVVTEISDQTDMLAINASIEAAHAGDVGKGFMVVADSVRGLAIRTQETVGESSEIINQVMEDTNGIIAKMNGIVRANGGLAKASARSLGDIESMHGRFAKTISMVAESADGSGQIEASVASMAENLGHVASVLEATKVQADEIQGSASSIQGEANELKDQLSRFVVGS